jgi:anti-sigma factor ChrR (cupin superfamily)
MSEMQHSPECEAVQAELGAYVDGELRPVEQAVVERHLAACDACEAELALLRLVTQSLRLVSRPEPSEAMRQRLLDQVTAELPPHRVTLICTERHGDEVLHRHEVRLTREPTPWPLPEPIPGIAISHIVRQYRQEAGYRANCYQVVESSTGRNHHE